MKVTSVRRIAEYTDEGAPMFGFINYIDGEKPIMLRRFGRQIASDVQDAFSDQVSSDNGQSWSEPYISLERIEVDGGYTVFVENATHYSAPRDLLVHFADQLFQTDLDGPNLNHSTQVRVTVDHPQAYLNNATQPVIVSTFGKKQGLGISFTHPFEDSRGRLLVTVQWQVEDSDQQFSKLGFPVREDMGDVMLDIWESALLIGTWNADNTLAWELGNPVPFDIHQTSRGLCEGTLAELQGGKLVSVLRGSNASWPEKPGYKWVAYSEDGGLNWSQPQPLACDDGSLLQSSATGSCLLRSATNNKLYWVGNLCLKGEKVEGNFPRSPLVIAEVQEEPFALRKDTITIVGDRKESEGEQLQLSNFRCYQDRESGEVVVCLTRFGENGTENDDWLQADCYEYRVSLD